MISKKTSRVLTGDLLQTATLMKKEIERFFSKIYGILITISHSSEIKHFHTQIIALTKVPLHDIGISQFTRPINFCVIDTLNNFISWVGQQSGYKIGDLQMNLSR